VWISIYNLALTPTDIRHSHLHCGGMSKQTPLLLLTYLQIPATVTTSSNLASACTLIQQGHMPVKISKKGDIECIEKVLKRPRNSDGTIHRIVSNIAILKAYRIVSIIAIIPSQTIQYFALLY